MKKIFIYLLMLSTVMFFVPISTANAAQKVKTKEQARQKINHLKWLEHVEHNKLYKNQQKLESTASSLATSKEKLNTTTNELADLEIKLQKASAEFSAYDFRMKSRIRKVYKSQRKGFFVLLLTANDFNTFLDRIYFESKLIKQDYNRMALARAKAKEIALLKYDIEEKKRTISYNIKSINYQQKSIQREIEQNKNMIHKLRTDRVAYERAEKELAKQSASIGTMINRSTRKSEVKVASGFIKPIAGRITSPFGYRTHPIFNSRTFHSGVDIGGQFRGAIRASNSGKVIYTGWYGGYGKVVIIDHGSVNGKPITTLYAHLDSIAVSNGAYVSQGQLIGREGTTGYSTGPHCHFEVRVNGKPVNPLNYI
ncbi:MAG: murein hydrolase activator EnvC family protein [Candidatus Gastranaerophilaceae bacterium]